MLNIFLYAFAAFGAFAMLATLAIVVAMLAARHAIRHRTPAYEAAKARLMAWLVNACNVRPGIAGNLSWSRGAYGGTIYRRACDASRDARKAAQAKRHATRNTRTAAMRAWRRAGYTMQAPPVTLTQGFRHGFYGK